MCARSLFLGLTLLVAGWPTCAYADPAPAPAAPESAELPALSELVGLARERAPEVLMSRAGLEASRSSFESGRMAPVGNPYLEIRADHGGNGVTKDVNIDGSLWLPVEISGQRSDRNREARDFVQLHQALVEQSRASASARTVRAYGAYVVGAKRLRVLGELADDTQAEARYYADRLAMGDATEHDAAMSAVDAARHRMQLSETQSEILRVRGELYELTGRNLDLGTHAVVEPRPTLFTGSEQVHSAPNIENAPSLRVLSAQATYYTSARERLRSEGGTPLNFGLLVGRGDLGETRLGAGLGYAFPLFRKNVPERARADAERVRALQELTLRRELFGRRVELLQLELSELRKAFNIVTESALPAAHRAVVAATETHRAGKGDLLSVLLARRDLSSLALSQLEILDKGWLLLSQLVEMTGELP